MAETHLTNDEFFARLDKLFESNRQKGHGTIHLSQKRFTYTSDKDAPSPADEPLWDTHPEGPLPIVIRASNNSSKSGKGISRPEVKKTRISTVVQSDQLESFFARYADACKSGMSGLKKRDRTKRKKDKKKKKGAAVETKS